MSIKLIIFDFDGVLIISNRAHIKACREALRRVGIKREISNKEITSLFGMFYRDVLRALMKDEYTPEKLNLASEYQSQFLYSDNFIRNVQKIDGLKEFLTELKGKGIKIAIASGNERLFLDKMLKFLEIGRLFDSIISADNVRKSKPDPEMIYNALKFFRVKPEETLFVGDAKNDIIAAKSAGVKSAVVLTGVLNKEDAEKLKPDFIISDVFGIWSFIFN